MPIMPHPIRPRVITFVSLAFAACTVACGWSQMTESPRSAQPTALRITRPNTTQRIAPELFSSFLEPIGRSIYGGLWADAIVNPSFEEGLWSDKNLEEVLNADPELRAASSLGLPTPWQPLHPEQGARYAPVRGDAANSTQSVLVMSLPDKEVGVFETVYLPAYRERSYHGSIWLKHVEGNASVRVSLRRHGHAEEILAESKLTAGSGEWTKCSFALALKPGALSPLEPVNFVLSLGGEARAMLDNVSLVPDDAISGMDPEVIALARELHSPLVRFGGNFTSAYDFHDGIGPEDKRVSMLNLAWGIPEYNTFGTGEFLRFCELVGARPQIALNMGTGTPEQAAEWVRYTDAHWGDHRGGLTWELGNELWGTYQVGYPSPDKSAVQSLAFSNAVRRVDPASHLIATGGDAVPWQAWNARELQNDAGNAEYISSHFILTNEVELPGATDRFRTMALLAAPWGLAGRIEAMHQQAIAAHRPGLKFAFTEWLLITKTHTLPNYSNVGGAIFAGGFLNTMMRATDAVSLADMTGILDFGGIHKSHGRVYAAPAYWVLRSYSQARPAALLEVSSTSPTYSIAKGALHMTDAANVPYLDVVVALSEDGKKLVLFCVNRSLDGPEAATLNYDAIGASSGEAKITTIKGDGILTENDEYDPGRVTGVTRQETLHQGEPLLFPSASVTVIELPIKPS